MAVILFYDDNAPNTTYTHIYFTPYVKDDINSSKVFTLNITSQAVTCTKHSLRINVVHRVNRTKTNTCMSDFAKTDDMFMIDQFVKHITLQKRGTNAI